jgi:hypothetical protein
MRGFNIDEKKHLLIYNYKVDGVYKKKMIGYARKGIVNARFEMIAFMQEHPKK